MNIWDLYIVSPLVNVLIVISSYLFHNFGLTIIVFTLIIRAAMWPLTIKQLRATKAMQSIQTQMAELQKKYGKDRRMLAQEQMKLYRQSGMNPAGCVLPMLVQLPVWIALYQAIIKVLAAAPEDFLSLSRYLYTSWPMVLKTVPLQSHFLWMDLAVPDTIFLLPILTGASMWVQQKMSTMPNPDPKQAQQSQMMLWMMPLMFVFLSMSFPSGLALYWVTSNVVGIVMQYFVTGWGGLIPSKGQNKGSIIDRKTKEPTPAQAPQLEAGRAKSDKGAKSAGGEVEHGESRGTGQDRGGGYAPGTRPARANPRRSTGRRRKGR